MLKRLLIMLTITAAAQAQNPVFTLNDASTYAAAQSGVGLGNPTTYDSYQLKNLFVFNPAMQPQQGRTVKTAASGSTTTLVSLNDFDSTPLNGYVGWTIYVAAHGGSGSSPGNGTGGAQGMSSMITASTANSGSSITLTFSALSSAIAVNDTVYLLSPSPTPASTGFGFTTFGWDKTTTGTGAVTFNTTDVPPALGSFASPVQCVQMTNTSGGDTSRISTYMDMGSTLNYIFSGGYHESIMIKVLSGTPTLTMTGSTGGFSWSNAVSPTGTWATYTTTFTGTQTTGSPAQNDLIGFTLSGAGSVCVAAASLTADSDNNPTLWRNQVITDLQTMGVGEIRYNMTGVQGTTLLNWITPLAYRQPSYLFPLSGGATFVQTGLHDFLVLAQYLNLPRVAIVVPNTWSNTDMSNLIDYMSGGAGTTYGALRISLGQTAGWDTVFKRIVIEYGNEVWNSTFQGSYLPGYGSGYWNYVELATSACGAAKANANYNTSVMKCSGSIQTINGQFEAGLFQTFDTSHNVDILNVQGYTQGGVNTCTAPALYRSGNTEVWAHANDPSDADGMYQAANVGIPLYVYEYNNASSSGGCTQLQMTGYAGGEAYGLTDILEPLYLNKKWGITDFNFWSLNQRYVSSGGVNMEDFGIKTGPGGALNNLRPAGYALGLMNGAINGGTGIAVTESNTPVYSPSAENGVNAETNVPYLNNFCFKNGLGRGCVVVNTDQSNPYTFTFAGTNTPQGSVTQVSYSAAVNANNESTLNVTNSTSTSSNPTSFTIPAHSALAVKWNALAAPTYPAIDPFSVPGPTGLSADWTNINTGGRFSGTVQQNSGVLSFSGGSGSDPIAVAYYSAETFSADQYAQLVIGPDTTFDTNSSPMIRVQAVNGNGYSWDYTTNSIRVWNLGSYTDLSMTQACPGVNTNDVTRVAAVGTTLYCIDLTTGAFGYTTDSTYTSGSPGVMIGSFSGHLLMSGPFQADCYPYSCNSVVATPYSPLYPWANVIDYYSSSAVSVTLSDQSSGWTFCYTTDGSTPAAATPGTCSHGTTYSTAFSVSATGLTTVKTLATKSGQTNSIENDYIYNIGYSAPTENGCQLFPTTSIFNTSVAAAPVDSVNNPIFQSNYGSDNIFHDFYEAATGGANGGIPFNSVGNSDPTYTITNWFFPSESDNGPYSISNNTVIENIPATGCTNTSGLPQSTDYHMLMVANLTGGCQLQEMYQASCVSGSPNVWSGDSGAVWTLSSNALRTNGWTSADAAGLPITPFLVKYDEALTGVIQHPFRFTLHSTASSHLWPARHDAGPGLIPSGSRLRLKAGYDITTFSPMNQVILQALKTYGMFVADNGITGYFQGVTDPRWTEVDLDLLNSIPFSNFEVVNEQGYMAAGVNSQQATIPTNAVFSKVYGGKDYSSKVH